MADAQILVVEDEIIVAEDIRTGLKRLGYAVSAVVSSGKEAIQKAAETHPDLVLMDIRLKGDIDGVEAAEQIRARFDIPVVYLTAHADYDILQRAKITEPFGYILKPFEGRELRINIEMALYKHNIERKLKESEQWLATTLRSIGDAVIATDARGCIRFMNPIAEALTGWKQEDALGRDLTEVFHIVDEKAHKVMESLAMQAVREGVVVSLTNHTLTAKGGRDTPIDESAAPIRDDRGNITGAVLVFHDATERKRTEEALRRYADEQAALYAVTSAVATSLDPEKLLCIVLDVVLSVLEADVGWVKLPGPTSDNLSCVTTWCGIPESLAAEAAAPLSKCPLYASIEAGGEVQVEGQLVLNCPCLPSEATARANLLNGVCIPLSAAGKTLGTITAIWYEPRPHSESDCKLLTAIGQEVGMALHNAHLYQAACQVDRLRVLNELDQALAATLDLETVAEITLRQIAEAVDAPMGALFVQSPQADTYMGRAFTLRQGWIEVVISEENVQRLQAFWQRMQDSGDVIPFSNGELIAVSGFPVDIAQWGSEGLVVPIWEDEELVMALALGGRPADQPFTEEDRSLAQAAASRAGRAIQSARLHQRTVWQLETAKTLSAVTTALTHSLNLDQVLQSIVDSATRLIPASTSSVIHLADEVGRNLIPQAISPSDVTIQENMRMPIGKGIAGLVMQEKRLINVPNVEKDPRFLSLDTGIPKKSLLTAPLMIDGDCIGTLSLNSDQVGAFSVDDEQLLAVLAAQATIAVRNARLHQEVQRRLQELVFLNQVGRTVASSLNIKQVLTTVMQEATDVLKVKATSILLLDDDGKELVFETVVGSQAEKTQGLRLSLGQGIAGWVAREGQRLLVPDVRKDPRFYPGIDEVTGFVTRSVLAVPLKVKGKVVGVIEAVNKIEGDFSQADVALLSAIAQPAAVAIENARLFEEVKQQHERLRALTARLAEAEEAERQRLARELHDRVGQNLTALGINLNIMQNQMSEEAANLICARLDDSLVLVEQTAECIRDVMADLRPPVLDDYGLVAALHWYGTQFTSRAGIAVAVEGEEPIPRLAAPVENALFRITQEALTNVARHAQATQVTVTVKVDNGAVCLVVADDGIGFDLARLTGPDRHHGWGLITMTERAEAVGGCCRIESGPQQGTRVVVEVVR